MTRFVNVDGPLARHEILQRAGLAAVAVFAIAQLAFPGLAHAGVTLAGARGAWPLLAMHWAMPLAFALVHRALQPRLDEALPPPSWFSAALAGAGIGFVAWAFVGGLLIALALAGLRNGYSAVPETAGLVAFVSAWRHLRARLRPRRPEWRAWRVPLALVAAVVYAAPVMFAIGAGSQMIEATVTYGWLCLPVGLWMAWIVFGRVIRGEPLGYRRRRRGPLDALVGAGLAAGAAVAVEAVVDLVDD